MSKRVEQGCVSTNLYRKQMVPVLSHNLQPLMPCSEKRARQRMERGQAIAYWQKGIFCIRLQKDPQSPKFQDVVVGIDPGSKREAYTVMTTKAVVLNITTNTPSWVKDHIEFRRACRRAKRRRKAPFRKCRQNRAVKRNFYIAPSTKARWDAKIRILKIVLRIIPITHLRYEDLSVRSKKSKKKWNVSFSPLQIGKSYFAAKLFEQFPKLIISKNFGKETSNHRKIRGFNKTRDKLQYSWSAHNVDSHSMCELQFKCNVLPYFGLYRIEFLEYHRRQLHVKNPINGGKRKQYGGTVSLGLSRGSIIIHNDKFYYLGGTTLNKLSIHSILTGTRVSRSISITEISIMYVSKMRNQFVPHCKKWVSIRKFV